MTEEEKDAATAKDKERKARSRSLKTEDERDAIRAKDKERKARSRSLMTEDQKEFQQYKDRNRKAKVNETDPYKVTRQYYLEKSSTDSTRSR